MLYMPAAVSEPIAAAFFSVFTLCTAAVVLSVSTIFASGRLSMIQFQHWAMGCGWEKIFFTFDRDVSVDSR